MKTLREIQPKERLTYVGLLTPEQAQSLQGVQYTDDSFFNPIQDASDNWVISVEEMEYCTNERVMWVKDLPLIEYVPKQSELI
jgi:hypothetical protein